MSKKTVEHERDSWPPPPRSEAGAEGTEQEPKPPRVTDQVVGRLSLAFSGLGTLCALAYALSSAADPQDRLEALWTSLQLGGAGCFFVGFFVGIVGWFSWEGKSGLSLALLSPLWILATLVIGLAVER